MKRIVALILSMVMLLTGCGQVQPQSSANSSTTAESESAVDVAVPEVSELHYNSLDDAQLLAYIQDVVYRDTVTSLDSDEYFVESVSTKYLSKEYLDETAFNSQSNIYFGYTLAELDELFQGKKYVFTLSEDGETTVQELQEIKETSTETMLKNVAIGTGVILICVTVSAVSAGAGAPAVSMIFAASAKTATTFAISSAAFGGISAGIVRGIQTGDFNEATEAATMGASEGFKWGAISGVIATGASYVKSVHAFQSVQLNGITPYQAAAIQVDSKYPVDVIARFASKEQYEICKSAGLTAKMVNGRTALVRKIDLNYVDELTGKTNLQLMQDGYAPLDPTGKKYQLHHIGQKTDSPLAILTQEEHIGKDTNSIWHVLTEGSDNPSSQPNWSKIREQFWENYAKLAVNGGI